MSESATAPDRRTATIRRIVRCARELTSARGLDGFTMEHLADAAQVSRRTLFNYLPGKYEAVLGPLVMPSPAALSQFRDGGPTGDLVDDLVAVLRQVFDDLDESPAEIGQLHCLMRENPRLIAYANDRFESLVVDLLEDFRARVGDQVSAREFRAVIAVLLALVHAAISDAVESEDPPPLIDLISDYVHAARAVFARRPDSS